MVVGPSVDLSEPAHLSVPGAGLLASLRLNGREAFCSEKKEVPHRSPPTRGGGGTLPAVWLSYLPRAGSCTPHVDGCVDP